VTLLDVGYQRPTPVLPDATFDQLKLGLPDPVAYFLGAAGEGVVYPATKPSYYGHPPSKTYVFATPRSFASRAHAMQPVFSFARGGLAEAWTAGCYEFTDTDLSGFPFSRSDLIPYYQEVARRIGVGAERDDLERFLPLDAPYLEPLPLDPHSSRLLDRYRERRARLNRDLGFYLGRSRVATLTHDAHGRRGCGQLGRCLWGCPREAIYSPAFTLRECLADPKFRYLAGVVVTHFDYDGSGRVTAVHAEAEADGGALSVSGDLYALAAGALCSSKLVLDSIYRRTGRAETLTGLMDNRQVHLPFLTLGRIGASSSTAAYQFHHLAFGLDRPDPREYIHGQITTLKAASVHPILAGMPTDLRTALRLFRSVRAGLGIANVNLHDTRRPDSRLTIRPLPESKRTELVIDYAEDPAETPHAQLAVRLVTRALSALGCVVPPGMTRVLPKGTSVHYTGTLPMTRQPAPLSCAPDGRSHDFPNLCLVDGATFPFLPAKNLTFTLMANALRIADLVL
jgi:choline dehydrogenase-like flavoprotein